MLLYVDSSSLLDCSIHEFESSAMGSGMSNMAASKYPQMMDFLPTISSFYFIPINIFLFLCCDLWSSGYSLLSL